jgi:hypothetical protein
VRSRVFTLSLVALGLLAAAASACGARSGLDGGDATSGGGASSLSTGSSSSSARASSSSTGGGAVCGNETQGSVGIAVDRFGGVHLGCGVATPGGGDSTTSFLAAVTGSSGGVVAFDECSPGSDCVGKKGQVTITAMGIGAAFLPTGAFVEIRLEESNNDFFCIDNLLIKNLATWDGAPNPAASGGATWIAASQSGTAFADAGYTVEPIPLHCFPHEMSNCGKHEDYLFRVGASGQTIDVPMGGIEEIGAPTWVFSNLASYTVDACDVPPRFAYLLFVPQLD